MEETSATARFQALLTPKVSPNLQWLLQPPPSRTAAHPKIELEQKLVAMVRRTIFSRRLLQIFIFPPQIAHVTGAALHERFRRHPSNGDHSHSLGINSETSAGSLPGQGRKSPEIRGTA